MKRKKVNNQDKSISTTSRPRLSGVQSGVTKLEGL